MRKVEVNLPDFVYNACRGLDPSNSTESRVALAQARQMYPWLDELLRCLSTECQRDWFLFQSYDLGEAKSDVRAGWDKVDRTRMDRLDEDYKHGAAYLMPAGQTGTVGVSCPGAVGTSGNLAPHQLEGDDEVIYT